MRLITLLLSALAALPASADTTMSAAEFDAYTRGKTLFYGRGGEAYGAEIYHDNRRVEWSFLDGDCKEGRWYEEAGLICFVYENNPDPQCWSFVRQSGGLVARFENDPGTTELYEAGENGQEMLCLGPKVGV
tara:strand:- start:69768 stop:70163 length:396 start_codon:yes stop_codon:yes gene_type:complete